MRNTKISYMRKIMRIIMKMKFLVNSLVMMHYKLKKKKILISSKRDEIFYDS